MEMIILNKNEKNSSTEIEQPKVDLEEMRKNPRHYTQEDVDHFCRNEMDEAAVRVAVRRGLIIIDDAKK